MTLEELLEVTESVLDIKCEGKFHIGPESKIVSIEAIDNRLFVIISNE